MWHAFLHRGCPDGTASGYALWKRYGRAGTYVPAAYNEPPHFHLIRPTDTVYLLDFCFEYDEMVSLIKERQIGKLIILDHHETREEAIRKIAKQYPKIVYNGYDVRRSGAMIAWQYFHPGEKIPKLIHHIQDRDLWQFQYEHTAAISMALWSHPQEFETWDCLDYNELIRDGQALLRQQKRQIDSLMRYAVQWRRFGEHIIPVINSSVMNSELAHEMILRYPDVPFVGVYMETTDKEGNLMRKWSLRSGEDGLDVSKIAEQYAGGGHQHAAGMREML